MSWDDDEPEECPRCGGYHAEEEHDLTPAEVGIPHEAWGPLYHGTPHEIEGGVIKPGMSDMTYNSQRMYGHYGHGTYVTTGFDTAKDYAGEHGTVHEVVPHPEDHGPYDYELDPAPELHGLTSSAPTLRDAHELASYGDEGGVGTALKFNGRMLSQRQFKVSEGERPWH